MQENNQKQFKVTEDLLAKFHKRLFNFVIDMTVWSLLLFIGLAFYIGDSSIEEIKDIAKRFEENIFLQYTVSSVITLAYYNFSEILTSRTFGKFCTNTIVVDENGEKAGYEAIMIRSLIRIIPMYWLSFIVSPLRGVHDLISKTYVVDKTLLDERKSKFYALQRENGL